MWGDNPTLVAKETAALFHKSGLNKILIPGIGYGRNAKPFLELGIKVNGIEISETAIHLAKTQFGGSITIFKGSVLDMPFDNEKYNGIFCHALIHLLDTNERAKFFNDCYNQLSHNGIMVFTAITKNASTYGIGQMISKDRYRTKDGVDLFFYDEATIQEELSKNGLIGYERINEPVNENSSIFTEFWKITCKK